MLKPNEMMQAVIECFEWSKDISAEEKKEFVDRLSDSIRERFGTPVLPAKGQTVAITFDNPKTAGLFFDRVWAMEAIVDKPPKEIMVYGATNSEIFPAILSLTSRHEDIDQDALRKAFANVMLAEGWGAEAKPAAVRIQQALQEAHKIRAVAMYDSEKTLNQEYKSGDTQAIVLAIENLRLVDEDKLTWRHVQDFRSDSEALVKLRRLRGWLDKGFVGKPISQITDEIGTRLDDYEWSLKKHGIQTFSGSMSELLDAKFISATSIAAAGTALAAGGIWAAVGTTALTVGQAAVSVTKKYIELKDQQRSNNYEIAFVHELKKIQNK